MLIVAAMLMNMIAETMWARVAAVPGSMRRSRCTTAAIASSGLHGEAEGVAVVGLLGVAEDHLSQVGAAVVDLGAVACHYRPDDRHHRFRHVGSGLGSGLAFDERFGVGGVLHEQEQFAFVLGVEEKGACADVGLFGDLLGGDLVDAVFGEELAGGGRDAVELFLLVPLTSPHSLRGGWHNSSLRE